MTLNTFDEGLGSKHQSYFYSVVLELFLCYSYLSDSTLRTSIFAQFLLSKQDLKIYLSILKLNSKLQYEHGSWWEFNNSTQSPSCVELIPCRWFKFTCSGVYLSFQKEQHKFLPPYIVSKRPNPTGAFSCISSTNKNSIKAAEKLFEYRQMSAAHFRTEQLK